MALEPVTDVRLDKWLWAARVYKTRSLAAEACRAGHVKLNGQAVKPSHSVKLGEVISAQVGQILRTVKIIGLLDRRVGAKLVGQFLEDLTPAEEYTKPREPRLAPLLFRPKGFGRPSKKERRSISPLLEPFERPEE